jgi:hypothetical protein
MRTAVRQASVRRRNFTFSRSASGGSVRDKTAVNSQEIEDDSEQGKLFQTIDVGYQGKKKNAPL